MYVGLSSTTSLPFSSPSPSSSLLLSFTSPPHTSSHLFLPFIYPSLHLSFTPPILTSSRSLTCSYSYPLLLLPLLCHMRWTSYCQLALILTRPDLESSHLQAISLISLCHLLWTIFLPSTHHLLSISRLEPSSWTILIPFPHQRSPTHLPSTDIYLPSTGIYWHLRHLHLHAIFLPSTYHPSFTIVVDPHPHPPPCTAFPPAHLLSTDIYLPSLTFTDI